jgi:hypothetical protein
MTTNLYIIKAAVSLVIKAAFMAAQWSGKVSVDRQVYLVLQLEPLSRSDW